MSRWFETIRVEFGHPKNIKWHQIRIMSTLLHHNQISEIDLHDFLKTIVFDKNTVQRCRIDYNKNIINCVVLPYVPQPLRSLQIVETNTLEYSYKNADRSKLENLRQNKKSCDDILIAINRRITDISYANIVFRHGHNLISPITPLLRGTQLSLLVERGQVQLQEIYISDIKHFSGWIPVNALLGFSPETLRPVNSICFP